MPKCQGQAKYSLLCLLMCVTLSTAASLGSTETSAESKDDLEVLLNDLKKLVKASSAEDNMADSTGRENENNVRAPSKRNCGVNAANDCAAIQTAHINGYAKFFGSKRGLESSRKFGQPTPAPFPAEKQQERVQNNRVELDKGHEDAIVRFLLNYILDGQQRYNQETRLADELCIERTGLPCGQQWQG